MNDVDYIFYWSTYSLNNSVNKKKLFIGYFPRNKNSQLWISDLFIKTNKPHFLKLIYNSRWKQT